MNTTDIKEFNEHIKSMGSDIDIEKMKNSRFTINVLMVHPCGFKITDQKYKEIVSNMTNQQLEKMQYENI